MRPTADHARTEMRVKSVIPGGLCLGANQNVFVQRQKRDEPADTHACPCPRMSRMASLECVEDGVFLHEAWRTPLPCTQVYQRACALM